MLEILHLCCQRRHVGRHLDVAFKSRRKHKLGPGAMRCTISSIAVPSAGAGALGQEVLSQLRVNRSSLLDREINAVRKHAHLDAATCNT